MKKTYKYFRILFWISFYLNLSLSSHAMVHIQEVVSDQGIKAWLIEDHTLPVISMELSFKAGSAYEPADKSGLVDLVAALLRQGAGPYSAQALHEKAQRLAISINVGSVLDFFNFSLKTRSLYAQEAFDLLKVIITDSHFDLKEVEKAKASKILNLKADEKLPDSVASKAYSKIVTGSHPYGFMPTESSIKRIKSEDLKNFVKQGFTLDTLKIGVCGDVTPHQLKILLDKTFGKIPRITKLPSLSPFHYPSQGKVEIIQMPITQSVALFGQQGVSFHHPDYIKQVILNEVIGGAFSRLYAEIRSKRGNAYYISTSLNNYDLCTTLTGGLGSENNRMLANIDLIKGIWRDIKQNGISLQELEDTKSYLIGAFVLNLNSSVGIASLLNYYQIRGYPIDFPKKRTKLIQEVTLESINDFASRFLDPDRLIFVIAGDLKH